MKNIDIRFSASDIADLQAVVGKKMLKYKCDPFEFSTSVYGIVGIAFEDTSFAFTNTVKPMDYYGVTEDVALFSMQHIPFDDIHSRIQNQVMIEMPIECIVSSISIVNERQKLFEKGIQTYEVLVTRGVIFHFDDDHELSFEKNIWFSEDITVEKGYNLLDKFTPTTEFEEGWSGDYRGECSREIITLK